MGDRRAPDSLVLVQALANTLDVGTGRDTLAAPEGAVAFLREHGVSEWAPGQRELAQLRELREALRGACLAHGGHDLPESGLSALDRLLTAAPLALAVDAQGRASLRPAPGLTGLPALTARIAAGIAAAADGAWPRLKACAADDCQWVYYDRSPAGRSRWCTMEVCGSRAKMRAYRARKGRSA